ncbi:unnamed protein product [Cunninghamella blakesleeana]
MTIDIPLFKPEWEEQDDQVIRALYDYEEKNKKELRHKAFFVDDVELVSWTMRDHLYKKNKYPTHARGLFTQYQKGKYSVRVRGYDKFFNINETDATQWHTLKKETEGPFEITAKENGCIIFISATTPNDLVATSKHTIPEPKDNPTNHGGIGYRWLLKQLSNVNIEPQVLADWLYHQRITLVCELCDDNFEEHIVPYSEKESGLYLHGINYNTTSFHTLPISIVHQVAKKYGFLMIDSIELNDFQQLEQLANDVKLNTSGVLNWMVTTTHHSHPHSNNNNNNNNNEEEEEEESDHQIKRQRESEGVVIRCKKKQTGDDFLFKVKNDTYLVYREYREVTKAIVEVQKNHQTVKVKSNLKPIKYHYEKTLYYIHWLLLRIKDHPEWFLEFHHNKGIVKVRQAFEKDWEEGLITFNNQLNIPVEKTKGF